MIILYLYSQKINKKAITVSGNRFGLRRGLSFFRATLSHECLSEGGKVPGPKSCSDEST